MLEIYMRVYHCAQLYMGHNTSQNNSDNVPSYH